MKRLLIKISAVIVLCLILYWAEVLPIYYTVDAEAAIKIVERRAIKIYGKQMIEEEKPLKATLRGDKWFVAGTLKEGYLGGTVEATVSTKWGRIISITHSK